ncbi:MAG TPA: nuclear transport factor 2 family protein [Pyrinomonadaceae bacterium]|nr:nuclear transport factor 2 family protein [Pyrinomonadaceae bacterium]
MTNNHDPDEQEIYRIERNIFTAIRTQDDEALAVIVADDFVFRCPGQPEIGKAEFLKSVKSFPVEILDIWSDDMKVNFFGDIALLTGVQRARTRGAGGQEQLSAGAFSDVFAKRNGRWFLVLAYNVELTETNSEASSSTLPA